MTKSLQVSYIELQGAEDNVESIKVIFRDDHQRSIHRKGDHIREDFSQPLTVRCETITIALFVAHRGWNVFPKKASKVIEINVHDIPSKPATREFRTVRNELTIILGLSPSGVSDNVDPGPDANSLHPTTEVLVKQFPCGRVLVIGQSGVGKSTLINRVFGFEGASTENFELGQADIEKELTSPQNSRFILHDSRGFVPGEVADCKVVELFIKTRKKQELVKDQLHAVWLCVGTPIVGYGEGVLYGGVKTFLEQCVLHNIPTIVVFTKYDRLLTYLEIQGEVVQDAASVYLEENCIQPIRDVVKNTELSFVAVGSEYERGLDQLIKLTYEKVTGH